jgi:ferredoxin/flavodoxin
MEKEMIFYFSATGNSKYVAEKIASVQNEKLITIADCNRNNQFFFRLTDEERIGFVFPVYFFGIPTVVIDFIQQLKLENIKNQYTFAVCTCGGGSAFTLNNFGKLLKKHGLNLNYGNMVVMPDIYIILWNLLPPEEKRKIILAEAEISIATVNTNISNNSLGIPKQAKGTVPYLMSLFSYPLYKFGRSTKPFYTTDECTGCGLCEKICPCGIIYLRNNHPYWKEGKCTQCLACVHRCPVSSIEYGKKTIGRERYVNPKIYN